ncbi:transporter associated domain-containing protein [Romboutsia lituseburensis]|uniref:transporter associated domain-containing protein n=1 Tax=Romboutsia lituseburensis TaxID=1537 RepID=UPI00215A774F|nr:transporter associated domain-containing protein [Romboutsia lituseburensis]MCR8744423.1 CBS domain-containing protein [Romboutsia lituseburensis]
MNILEPEPERTLSQSNFQKISLALADAFQKISELSHKNREGKILALKKNKEALADEESKINSQNKLHQKTVREIMTSRKDTFTIDIEDDIDSILDSLANIKYSKIPVYEKNIDNIIGILYVKDLLIIAKERELKSIDIRNILHQPNYVPETKYVKELYDSINSNNDELFILVDEYGGFSGIVTLDDLMYEIKGITYDKEIKNSKITKIDEKNFIVKGFLTLSDFNKVFRTNIEQGDYDTLSGYIIDQLGQIPDDNENIEINLENLILKLTKIDNRRIEEIHVCIAN